jgi:hypothetical protein
MTGVLIFDEAQRAWDAAKVKKKHKKLGLFSFAHFFEFCWLR